MTKRVSLNENRRDGDAVDDEVRILVLVRGRRDRELLVDRLGDRTVVVGDPDESLPEFDLCLVDAATYPEVERRLAERKAAAAPVHLPVLLIVGPRDDEAAVRELADVADDVLSVPAPGAVVRARVESMLRLRRQSLAIDAQRERLALYRRAMDNATSGITIADADGDQPLIYVNDAFVEMTGYERDEALGRNCRFLQGEATDPEPVREMREAVEAGEPAEVELRNYRKDGTPFWNQAVITPVSDGEEVTHFLGFQRDVTERKEREQERERLFELLERTQEIANVGGWEVDPDTGTVLFTEQLSRMLGVDPETTFPLEEAFEFFHPDDERVVRDTFASLLADFETKELECRIVTADDEVRWVQVKGAPRRTDGRRIVRGTVLDITERKRRERSLERYKRIVETTSDPIYTLDGELRFTLVNKATVQFTGRERPDLTGDHVSAAFGPDHAEALADATTHLLASDATERTIETGSTDAAGNERRFQTTITLKPADDGEFHGVVCVSRDITDLTERERRLSVLDRVLRHNLRNKMNIILGKAAAITEATTDDDVRTAVDGIERAADELVALGESARRFHATLDATAADRLAVRNVADHARRVVEEARANYDAATVTVDAPDEAWVRVHETLEVSLTELVDNAAKHGGPDVSVTVTVREDPAAGQVVVRVADDGPGMPDIERHALTSGLEGPIQHSSGLGLWFVRWMTTNSGGSFSITENEPTGTVVELRLPSADPDAGGA